MNSLPHRPCGHYRWPAYPTRLEVRADPDLLARHVPSTWLGNRELAGAFAALLAVNTGGCRDSSPAAGGSTSKPGGSAGPAIVAPIFEHGNGRSVSGCVVVNTPAYVSEEEAIQIIAEELTRAGLQMDERHVVKENVYVPPQWLREPMDILPSLGPEAAQEELRSAKPFQLHLKDPRRHVGVKFVGHRDYFDLGGQRSNSSVQEYDFKETARDARNRVGAAGSGLYVGLLYDPSVYPPVDWLSITPTSGLPTMAWEFPSAKAERAAEAESRRLLRLQVKDFIDWLKAQGVI